MNPKAVEHLKRAKAAMAESKKREEDKKHLIEAGFKEENIHFDKINVHVRLHNSSYPYSDFLNDDFLIPKIYK